MNPGGWCILAGRIQSHPLEQSPGLANAVFMYRDIPILFAAAFIFAACPAAAAGEPAVPLVEQLFDGKSFAGWNGDTKNTWRIEDGAIVAGSASAVAPRNEFLATDRSFGDFELRLEYRLECGTKCNAGIQFRTVRIPDHHEVIGYQADIGTDVEGCLYDESRRKVFLARASEEELAKAHAQAKDGWNEYLIRCAGRRIQLSINGVTTVDYTEADPAIPQQGLIALQIHGDMRGTIRYRNIRITCQK